MMRLQWSFLGPFPKPASDTNRPLTAHLSHRGDVAMLSVRTNKQTKPFRAFCLHQAKQNNKKGDQQNRTITRSPIFVAAKVCTAVLCVSFVRSVGEEKQQVVAVDYTAVVQEEQSKADKNKQQQRVGVGFFVVGSKGAITAVAVAVASVSSC